MKNESLQEIFQEVNRLENLGIPFIKVGNKIDAAPEATLKALEKKGDFVLISAQGNTQIDLLKEKILEAVSLSNFKTGDTIVTNLRHYQSLQQTAHALDDVIRGLDLGVTNDFLAMDIRQALFHLGEITVEISTDDLLANIFSKFCIGK